MEKSKKRVIAGRSGPTPNQVAWAPLEGQLPMTHVVQGNRFGGFFALVVGLPWPLMQQPFGIEPGINAREGRPRTCPCPSLWALPYVTPKIIRGRASRSWSRASQRI